MRIEKETDLWYNIDKKLTIRGKKRGENYASFGNPGLPLKPWMFEDATAIMNSGKADNAVCLMDIPDDFGKDNPDLYKKAYDAAIRFAKQFPTNLLWCYGNHDLSYVWSKPETGFNPAVRMLVREKLEELERTLSSPSQLAYIHKIDKTLFMHGGLSNFFVHRWVTQSGQKAIGKTIKEINKNGQRPHVG